MRRARSAGTTGAYPFQSVLQHGIARKMAPCAKPTPSTLAENRCLNSCRCRIVRPSKIRPDDINITVLVWRGRMWRFTNKIDRVVIEVHQLSRAIDQRQGRQELADLMGIFIPKHRGVLHDTEVMNFFKYQTPFFV